MLAPMKTSRSQPGIALAPCSFQLPEPNAGNTIDIQFTPAGPFRPADGRPLEVPAWVIDQAIAARVIARVNERRTPPVIDYEHQTLHKEENGQPAPAAGWLRRLEWREGQGLFGTVELTLRARQLIADREYRYFSPVFSYDRRSGAVLDIKMGALTNSPAIDGMRPLELRAAATFIPSHEEMSVKLLSAVIAALGLNTDADEDAAIAALTSASRFAGEVRHALDLDAAASDATVTAACSRFKQRAEQAKPDPAEFVPLAVFQETQAELAALSATLRAREADTLVQQGLADGRLLPGQEAWARELGNSNPAALTAYLKSTRPIAALTGTQTQGKPPAAGSATELSAEELAVCTHMGIAPEAFAKAKTA